ncbi:hypothetical protein HDU87_006612 [Geranomyces variabilis]|uniref:Uncharacterized protein n=1 Tax=Geranomyces variabilis TaxID=109894 RepID=A0AAD5XNV3_9FUNG|nr:hypothetical protein HDU87_006612 [Geranomyces variabilis]
MSYERLPPTEDDVSFASAAAAQSSSSSPAPSAARSAPTPHSAVDAPAASSAAPRDGVFGNLTAKDEPVPRKVYEELEPPSYHDAAPPTYYETTVVSSGIAEDGEVLIDGMPVGDGIALIINMLVSMSFDFIGFLLTAMLATTHAARAGSRIGFGITLVRYGSYMRTREDEMIQEFDDQYDPNTSPAEIAEDEQELRVENEWLSYIFLMLGFFIILRANMEYVRAKRLQAVVLATTSDMQAA